VPDAPDVQILWFRRDLRLADHPALAEAARRGPVLPLFVVDPAFDRAGAPRRAFLDACLRSLDAEMGGALVLRHGDPVAVVPALAEEVGAAAVVASADFGPYGTRRDAAVAARLTEQGRRLDVVGSPYAVPPGTVRKADGTAYAVFTPFWRAWQAAGWGPALPVPEVAWHGAPHVPCDGYPAAPDPGCTLPPAGERAAHDRLDAFLASAIDDYADRRDQPGVEGTSRLSPYLRWGCLHPRQVLARLGSGRGHEAFARELCWREFYADVLHHRPETAWRNLQPKMDALPVDTGAAARERFARWAAGQTGYPIVDAGMRELAATGWMHNRVRMIVASFLVKDLHVPWQWGARHFLDHLVDGDLASNNHGWQWTAGTGTDAAPYFRVFNPVSQGQRFDADSTYIRRWVPELAHVAGSDVHAPWQSRRGTPLGYPPPMVDHAVERAEALRRYAVVTGGTGR
jgi:deoxyribodipyrimidine photo-lyase